MATTHTRVLVIAYEQSQHGPRFFDIPIEGNRLVFKGEAFSRETGFPDISFSVYDTCRRGFIEIGTYMSMEMGHMFIPKILIRKTGFSDDDCLGLAREIERVQVIVYNPISFIERPMGIPFIDMPSVDEPSVDTPSVDEASVNMPQRTLLFEDSDSENEYSPLIVPIMNRSPPSVQPRIQQRPIRTILVHDSDSDSDEYYAFVFPANI